VVVNRGDGRRFDAHASQVAIQLLSEELRESGVDAWPISDLCMTRVTVPSVPILTKALMESAGTAPAAAAASAAALQRVAPGSATDKISPPPARQRTAGIHGVPHATSRSSIPSAVRGCLMNSARIRL